MIDRDLEPLTYTEYLLLPMLGVPTTLFGTLIAGVILHDSCEWLDVYCYRGLAPDELPENVYCRSKASSMVTVYRVLVPGHLKQDVLNFAFGKYSHLTKDALSEIFKNTSLPIDAQSGKSVYSHIYILALQRSELVHDFIDKNTGEYLQPFLYNLSSGNHGRFPFNTLTNKYNG